MLDIGNNDMTFFCIICSEKKLYLICIWVFRIELLNPIGVFSIWDQCTIFGFRIYISYIVRTVYSILIYATKLIYTFCLITYLKILTIGITLFCKKDLLKFLSWILFRMSKSEHILENTYDSRALYWHFNNVHRMESLIE